MRGLSWSHLPSINGQSIMLNDGVQPNPVFIILLLLQYQDNSCPLPCLDGIVKRLSDGFSPLRAKVKFNSVGVREAITPGSVWKDHFHLPVVILAPLGLIPLFRMQPLCLGRGGHQQNSHTQRQYKKALPVYGVNALCRAWAILSALGGIFFD